MPHLYACLRLIAVHDASPLQRVRNQRVGLSPQWNRRRTNPPELRFHCRQNPTQSVICSIKNSRALRGCCRCRDCCRAQTVCMSMCVYQGVRMGKSYTDLFAFFKRRAVRSCVCVCSIVSYVTLTDDIHHSITFQPEHFTRMQTVKKEKSTTAVSTINMRHYIQYICISIVL